MDLCEYFDLPPNTRLEEAGEFLHTDDQDEPDDDRAELERLGVDFNHEDDMNPNDYGDPNAVGYEDDPFFEDEDWDEDDWYGYEDEDDGWDDDEDEDDDLW